jgi:hypothetical protein
MLTFYFLKKQNAFFDDSKSRKSIPVSNFQFTPKKHAVKFAKGSLWQHSPASSASELQRR